MMRRLPTWPERKAWNAIESYRLNQEIVRRIAAWGYDLDRLRRVPQQWGPAS